MKRIKVLTFIFAFIFMPLSIANGVEISNPKTSQTYGGGTGGKKLLIGDCQPGQALVGVSINTYYGVSIWCNLLAENGISEGANSPVNSLQFPVYGNTTKNIFCPTGQVATSLRVQSNGYANGLGLICNQPPFFNNPDLLTKTIDGNGTWKNISCPNGFLTGIWLVVGDWIDRIGARCSTLTRYTLSFDANNGDAAAPLSQIIFQKNKTVSLPSTYAGKRTGLSFNGWNTAADGSGEHHEPGASIAVGKDLKLYVEWQSLQTNFEFQNSSSALNPKLKLTNLQAGQKIRVTVRSGK